MDILTVLFIILAALAALGIVYFQYFFKKKKQGTQKYVLGALRFITIFCVFLLLINPQFVKKDYFIEKSKLILLTDGSSSMQEHTDSDSLNKFHQFVLSNAALQQRFDFHQYGFGSDLYQLDSISMQENNTDIAKSLKGIDEIFGKAPRTVILFSDGNQTLGQDYSYYNVPSNSSVHSVIVGDTTQFEDLAITSVNVNKYAFLENQFPVEVQLVYNGKRAVSSSLSIQMDGRIVYQENLNFHRQKKSHTVNALIEATSVGNKSIIVKTRVLDNERNQFNNTKESAIEVIDEKSKIGIVSELLHPDIGALKRAIEKNEQREVVLIRPNDSAENFEDINLFILYQPNRSFKRVYDYLDQTGVNRFTITGSKTDWFFLNQIQRSFFKEGLNQTEELLPVINQGFSTFGIGELSMTGYPPLIGQLGDIELNGASDILITQRIRGVDLDAPLFCFLTEGSKKEAVLFGENIWRWRAQNYRDTQSFEDFDGLISKIMVFLSTNNRRNRLELDYDKVYDIGRNAKVRTSFYDKSYAFDPDANLTISIEGVSNDFTRNAPMLLKGSFYEIDLSDLTAGEYRFTVTESIEGVSANGSFKIIDHNPEKQQFSADFGRLKQLSENNGGSVFFTNQLENLVAELANGQKYTPIQKSRQNVVSLIDFRVLLGIMALALAIEWFIRKYNGLI